MEKKHIFLILLIVGTAFWGISFSVTKLAIGNYSSSLFMFYRFLGATIVLSVIFWKEVKKTSLSSLLVGAGLAIPLCFGIYLQTLGITHTSASQCSFVAGSCVVIIPVLKLLFYRKAAPLKIWVAAVIALCGLFVISIKENFNISIGDLYTITGSFGFSIYLIMVERQAAVRNLISTIVPMFAMSTVLAFILALSQSDGNWMPANQTFWLGIAFCALFSTAYMYTVSNISQRYISAEKVAIIYLFEPVFGAITAVFMLGESISWRILLGGCLIFAATVISEVKFKKPALVVE
ncbi:DMT family transporter [Mucilaginibacter conchicola]|uniref:DMT family transporter n=1 Tax=Mucilaginibacter conchicola TaxID=2303333 RepID=A0A372NXU0_9SPHI|nr:DMT family transporter [Mucilaginibacter conchicola]RFZ94920.1 DMT family transporter [Mucilaginibacter conchicola]